MVQTKLLQFTKAEITGWMVILGSIIVPGNGLRIFFMFAYFCLASEIDFQELDMQ
jgi:hypothetical protein